MKKTKTREAFDKYHYYHLSVQSPESDVSFMHDTYKELRGKKPKVLREDFCAAFANCCSWVQQGKNYSAVGIDLDPEPIAYGKKHYLSKLKTPEQARVHILKRNVLSATLPSADIVCALNFSYYCFKERKTLANYFRSVFKTLNKNGLLILDCFGGSQCQEANIEETVHDDHGFSYFWDQDSFDPITNYSKFYIHFKRKGEARRDKVFSYDWRMWTIPELRDLLKEAGFKDAKVYWEGTTRDGEGDGVFTATETGEECESWISYIVASK